MANIVQVIIYDLERGKIFLTKKSPQDNCGLIHLKKRNQFIFI